MNEYILIEKNRLHQNNLIIRNLCNQIIKSIELHEKLKNKTDSYATITRENALIDLQERANELLNRLDKHNDVTKLISEN